MEIMQYLTGKIDTAEHEQHLQRSSQHVAQQFAPPAAQFAEAEAVKAAEDAARRHISSNKTSLERGLQPQAWPQTHEETRAAPNHSSLSEPWT